MKKLLALLIGTVSTLAIAAAPEFKNVPAPLQKSLSHHGLKTAQLDNGVLRLQMDKPEVSELVYTTFIYHGICAEQWRSPERFTGVNLARVELLNTNATQGYAFDARGDVCVQMGQMGKNYRTFINQYTVKCEGGTCPRP
ncbi:hypothetical protein [Simplicispira lacusdiani]|uniref:hypothetical protein n=1 Tax=Simplicispira lacusdiani TaxID=2213010 RepID=UPI000E735DFA|nr:hypothetical protein [Simplicispira lacusdiani]